MLVCNGTPTFGKIIEKQILLKVKCEYLLFTVSEILAVCLLLIIVTDGQNVSFIEQYYSRVRILKNRQRALNLVMTTVKADEIDRNLFH